MEKKLIITEFTDPVCTWCWGSEPVLRKLQTVYQDQLDVRFIMGGLVPDISDFMDEMNILEYDDLEVEDFTTLGGMAMFFIGRIPKEGDTFTYRHLQFEVVDMDNGRVDKLLVTPNK